MVILPLTTRSPGSVPVTGRRFPRRAFAPGIAMLLVIVSLATMAVMTAAYLASQGNSTAVAENAAKSLQAESAAKAASDLAQAVLQADLDLTPEQMETLFENFNMEELSVSAQITTLEGTAPTGEAEPLLVTIVAQGPTQTSRMQMLANFDPDPSIEGSLENMDWAASEFAIFGRQSVTIEPSSAVVRWSSSPLAHLGRPLKLGSNSESSGAIRIKSSALVAGAHAFLRPSASSGALDDENSPATASRKDLPSGLPIIDRPMDYTVAFVWPTAPGTDFSGQTTLLCGIRKLSWMQIRNGSVVTVRGDTKIAVVGDMLIDDAILRIDGNAQIFIFDDLTLVNGAAIELTEGSRLELFVANDLTVTDSAIGFSKSVLTATLNPAADRPYADPKDIWIVGGHVDPNTMTIEHSLVRGRIYAQLDTIQIRNQSALYGSVLGRSVEVKNGSYIHYDHSLDCGAGYTVTNGPLYGEDGLLLDRLAEAIYNSNFLDILAIVLSENEETAPVAATSPLTAVSPLTAASTVTTTPRIADRCIARPRPTKALSYEGRPLANAEQGAQ